MRLTALILFVCLLAQTPLRADGKNLSHLAPTSYALKNTSSSETGALDGLTLFRFSQLYQGLGGIQLHIQHLNQKLLERNRMTLIQMHYVSPDSSTAISIRSVGRGTLIEVPTFYTRLPELSTKRRVEETIRDHAIDLAAVHFMSLNDTYFVADFFHRKNIPSILECHGDNEAFMKNPLPGRHAHGVSGVSSVGVPDFFQEEFEFLGGGVDLDFFDPDKMPTSASEDIVPVILLPARISQEKGHFEFLKVLYRLHGQGISFKAVFVGPTDKYGRSAYMKKQIRDFSMDSYVEVQEGDLSAAKIREWYSKCAVVALPSFTEGLPRVLLEAQAMKKPVVANRVGGVSQALEEGVSGFSIEGNNQEIFAERLAFLLAQPQKRAEMGEAGRDFVKTNFSLDALAERHERYYLKIIAQVRRMKSGQFQKQTNVDSAV